MLPTAPVNLRIPPGWEVTRDGGIQRVNRKGVPVGIGLPRGSFIFNQMTDLNSGRMSLEVGFQLRGRWKRVTADRSVFKDRTALTRMADTGLPVAAHTAPVLIHFLDELEAVNEGVLPEVLTTSTLGWHRVHGEPCFQLNANTTLPGAGAPDIHFKAADPGEQQIASAPRTAGTPEAWREAIAELDGLIGPALVVHASLASALIEPLSPQTSSFLVSLESRTSAGKTTAMLIGSSVWGAPVESGPHSLVVSCDTTQVHLERRLATHHSIPLFIDDTKRARDPRQIGEIPYLVAQGQGRGRGNKLGLDVPREWRLVALITGEAPISSYTTNGGAHARVLPFRRPPFGEESPQMANCIAKARSKLIENYGHAGRDFVKKVLEEFRRDHWEGIKLRHRELTVSYAQESRSGAVQRMAAYAAVVHLAGELATNWGILPPPFRAPMRKAWQDILVDADDPGGERRAYLSVIDWARANPLRFQHHPPLDPRYAEGPPSQGWAGFWLRRKENAKPNALGFFPHVLEEVLRGLGYDPPAGVLNGWRDLGLLHLGEAEAGGRRRLTKQVRMRDKTRRLIVLDLSKADEEAQLELDAEDDQESEDVFCKVGVKVGLDDDGAD